IGGGALNRFLSFVAFYTAFVYIFLPHSHFAKAQIKILIACLLHIYIRAYFNQSKPTLSICTILKEANAKRF
ncbi:hypothetical protein, partial [Helicobacter ganmani]|uniref:hypothetical protein n=3 Tax=Helicobacter TaxID=209 RepID=UPI003A8BE1F0